jgi:hypothetical protein
MRLAQGFGFSQVTHKAAAPERATPQQLRAGLRELDVLNSLECGGNRGDYQGAQAVPKRLRQRLPGVRATLRACGVRVHGLCARACSPACAGPSVCACTRPLVGGRLLCQCLTVCLLA